MRKYDGENLITNSIDKVISLCYSYTVQVNAKAPLAASPAPAWFWQIVKAEASILLMKIKLRRKSS
ncbi:MAG: hypothetical protein HFG51_13945 [Lachnospiraceae bacterium]|nr:hypothetical protein [Lachnospiraceae bacterium]